jgi:hypothetical protein
MPPNIFANQVRLQGNAADDDHRSRNDAGFCATRAVMDGGTGAFSFSALAVSPRSAGSAFSGLQTTNRRYRRRNDNPDPWSMSMCW